MAAGDTVGSKFLLEPSSANNVLPDASGTGTISSAGSGTVAITTIAANTVIFVFAALGPGAPGVKVTSISDTRSLVWNKFAAVSIATSLRGEVWWAFEPTGQSHTITVNLSTPANAALVAGSFNGAYTALPIDPQSLVGTTGTGTAPSASGTNMNPADVFVGFVACASNPTLTVGAGYTTINSVAQSTNVSAGAEYQKVTASAATMVNYTLGTSQSYVLIGFAFMCSGNNNFQTVQPAPGVEEVVHDVFGSGPFGIILTDGVNSVLVDSPTGPKWDSNLTLHLTNAQYMVIANTSAVSPGWFGFDGIQTK